MSEKQLQLFRESVDAFLRSDWEFLRALTHPDCVVTEPAELPGQNTWRGSEAVVDAMQSWPKQWDEFDFEMTNVQEAGEDQLVTTMIQHVGARGASVDQEIAFVVDFDDDRIVRLRMYLSEGAALEAARGTG